MPQMITKRDGSVVSFDITKVVNAILKAGEETGELGQKEAVSIANNAILFLQNGDVTVERVQDSVEDALLDSDYNKTAKAYIIYRDRRSQERKPDIFKPRLALKPYEYPGLYEYTNAIRESYWIHTEFNFTSDIHDFKQNTTPAEQNAIKNAMLAIAQVEVSVKTFWGDIFKRMPKPEIGSVGYTFAESEVRHHDAYSHLLELLGLNNEFEKIKDIPALMQRVNYLSKSTMLANTESDRDYTLSVLLFSLFIEHVSLFSQFLIIMSFNKHKNQFKGVSNVIEATSKEEELHGLFGIDVINTIRNEHPEWFDEEMKTLVIEASKEAMRTEEIVIDWIYEAGDLDFMPKQIVKEFVKNRLNNSLESIGYERIFEVDQELVEQTDWFDDEVIATKHSDFFVKRPINYTKRSRSTTGDDLF